MGVSLDDVTFSFVACDERLALAFEDSLIKTVKPRWNTMGFGNHFIGYTRMTQKPAAWDVEYARMAPQKAA